MPAWSYRCVAFDLDGTMTDTEPVFERAVSALLTERGLSLTPELAHRMLGTPTRQAFEHLREHFGLTEDLDALCQESIDRLFALFDVDPPPLLPGVFDLLVRLAAGGIPRAIATSSHREHVHRVLKPHGVLERFAFVMTCEDVSRGKPSPEIYEKTAAKFGCSPGEMVVLEDSPNGLRAAKDAGVRCIVIANGRVSADAFGLADAIVTSLEAPEFLELMGFS